MLFSPNRKSRFLAGKHWVSTGAVVDTFITTIKWNSADSLYGKLSEQSGT
jgi:hypothetical protein